MGKRIGAILGVFFQLDFSFFIAGWGTERIKWLLMDRFPVSVETLLKSKCCAALWTAEPTVLFIICVNLFLLSLNEAN